ncbi:hypothetical protein BAUCODRAFT_32491 [Baudoinia panamericana UAMH 10762]|uniref:Uncharacterized protein n=1 Tax=Baudoinia panamericana (strain UAMH 10762) TaxID=717646 RepID=M2MP22_BAUPA|nr:uncharacterized protein BAUCODRAFT_32491 [Baudoinia panamericana UAMH 10762]EMC98451.1 hypothetical protein BAUCODRAFT_32491 [Baudoinia panamericana UAMH 10762]
MLIVGFNRVNDATDGADMQGQLVYAYVKMFADLLDTFSAAPEAELNRVGSEDGSSGTGKRPTSSKGKSSRAQKPKQLGARDMPSLNAMTSFLCGMLALLDATSEGHGQMFEGFAYCVLTKLGACLYTCVFGQSRGDGIEAEIMANNQTSGETTHDEPHLAAKQDSPELQQARMQAPYLLHLLTRLMTLAPTHLGSSMLTKTGKPRHIAAKNVSKASLAVHAREKLQRTLLKCTFGDRQDDALMDCLKMPGMPEKALPMPKVGEVDVREWFTEEVWRLVGWDVLSSSNEKVS